MKILDFKGFLTHPALGPELPKQSRAAKQEALPVGEKCRERRYAHRFTTDAEAPSVRIRSGRSAVGTSWPVSARKLANPMPATPGVSHPPTATSESRSIMAEINAYSCR